MSEEHYYGDLSFIGVIGYSLLPEGILNQRTGNILNPKRKQVVLYFPKGECHSVTLEMLAFCADNRIPLHSMRHKRIDTPKQRERILKRYKNLLRK